MRGFFVLINEPSTSSPRGGAVTQTAGGNVDNAARSAGSSPFRTAKPLIFMGGFIVL